jgi:hypothetical protein
VRFDQLASSVPPILHLTFFIRSTIITDCALLKRRRSR